MTLLAQQDWWATATSQLREPIRGPSRGSSFVLPLNKTPANTEDSAQHRGPGSGCHPALTTGKGGGCARGCARSHWPPCPTMEAQGKAAARAIQVSRWLPCPTTEAQGEDAARGCAARGCAARGCARVTLRYS